MNSRSIINNIIPQRIPISTLKVLSKPDIIEIMIRDYNYNPDEISHLSKEDLISLHRNSYLKNL